MTYLAYLRKQKRWSERMLSQKLGIARETLRQCEQNPEDSKSAHLTAIAQMLDHKVLLGIVPLTPVCSELSAVAVSMQVVIDGFSSWKIHFMNLADEFRRCPDIRLFLLPPLRNLDFRLQALLASIVTSLCNEVGLETPDWAKQEMFLSTPWFVAEIESLKASALVESPLAFRRNNIFVLENFLDRV